MANNYDLSDLGGVQQHDLSDLGGTLENSSPTFGQHISNMLSDMYQGGKRDLEDVASGIMQSSLNLTNTIKDSLHAVAPNTFDKSQPYDVARGTFGINDPNILDKTLQGIGQYAPYAIGGEAALPAALLKGSARIFAGAPITGAAFGATQSPSGDRTSGAIQGAAWAPAAELGMQGIGKGLDILGNLPAALKNKVLNSLEKASAKGSALTPEQTAQNVYQNYTTNQGEQMPVDIGTAVNNPGLQNTFRVLQKIPFSGASGKTNLLNTQLAEKSVQDAQSNVENSKGTLTQALTSYNNEKTLTDNLKNNINSNLNDVTSKQSQLQDTVDSSNTFLNNLKNDVPQGQSIGNYLKNSLLNAFKLNKKISNQKYSDINNFDTRIDNISTPSDFSNYGQAASEALANRDNLKSIFGSSSDLGKKLNSELDKAQAFNDQASLDRTNIPYQSNDIIPQGNSGSSRQYTGQDVTPIHLQDIISRIQNLGRLASSAFASGNRNESRILGSMRDGLEQDIHNILQNNGHSDISDQLKDANQYYKENVIPFYNDKSINKTVTNKNYVPAATQLNSLANALHNSNNYNVLKTLPDQAKNASLFQLVTEGDYGSSGKTSLNPREIANKYGSINGDLKRVVSSYNPNADQFLENLGNTIDNNKALIRQKSQLQKQLSNIDDPSTKPIEQAQKQLDRNSNSLAQALQDQFSAKKQPMPSSETANNALKIGAGLGGISLAAMHPAGIGTAAAIGAPLMAASRYATKVLTDPELLSAYLSKSRFPINESFLTRALNKRAGGK